MGLGIRLARALSQAILWWNEPPERSMLQTAITATICSACIAMPSADAATPAQAGTGDHIDIVIVAGQSNARAEFAEGVAQAIAGSGRYERAEVFHRFHGGNKIKQWVIGSAPGVYEFGPNFLADFWNPDGSAGLQERIREIETAGQTWDIAGFVWFQGEADSAREYDRVPYPARFHFMLNALEDRFTLDHDLPFVITLIDYNGDDDLLLDAYRYPEDIEATREMQRGVGDSTAIGAWIDSRDWPRLDLWHLGDHDDPDGIYAPSADFGRVAGGLLTTRPEPLSRADLDANRIHDLADIALFAASFAVRDPKADIAPPVDRYDLADLLAFIEHFTGVAD